MLLEKRSDIFSYSDCSFVVQKAKEGTGRDVGWKELNITNSFTLEASFCGCDKGRYADLHFNTQMLQEMGHRFCEAIIDYCEPDQVKVKAALDDIELLMIKGPPEAQGPEKVEIEPEIKEDSENSDTASQPEEESKEGNSNSNAVVVDGNSNNTNKGAIKGSAAKEGGNKQ